MDGQFTKPMLQLHFYKLDRHSVMSMFDLQKKVV